MESVTEDPRRSGDAFRASDIVLTEIAKLQNDGEYTKRDLSEMRTDIRNLRDRMTTLEERVLHLPSKEFIVVVVTTALLIVGGIMTIAPKLWSWAGTSTAAPVAASASPAKPPQSN
jgi:hypothetical protein